MTTTNKGVRLLVSLCALIVFFTVLAMPTLAQTNKADIVGTVTDTNGAAVNGATITITKVDTNTSRTVTSGGAGEYQAPSLEI